MTGAVQKDAGGGAADVLSGVEGEGVIGAIDGPLIA